MLRADDDFSLSLLYHWNSLPRTIPEGLHVEEHKEYAGGVGLPASPPPTALDGLIRERRSVREFERRELEPPVIGRLLENACLVPSAGALHPLELYVFHESGLAHYNKRDHALERVGDRPPAGELEAAFLGQPWVEQAGALFAISCVFPRNQRKYGSRGYRYGLLQAGHAAQNICLTAASFGLASVCLGGFDDRRVNALLGFDGREEAVLYAVAAGYPTGAS